VNNRNFHNRTARKVLATSLLIAASGFAGSIGSLAEANSDTSTLIVTQWGIPQGSYVLSLNRFSTDSSSPFVVTRPQAAVTNTNTNTNASASQDTSQTTTNRQPAAPIFIMQPNLGFQVILTADYNYESPTVGFGPAPAGTPAIRQQDTMTTTYTLSASDTSTMGVSDAFVGAPFGGGSQLSDAGALFSGDSAMPPVVLTAGVGGTMPQTILSADPGATGTPTGKTPSTGPRTFDQIGVPTITTSVPEPSTAIGLGLALAGLGWLKHRSSARQPRV
jgi:hypothetical protein